MMDLEKFKKLAKNGQLNELSEESLEMISGGTEEEDKEALVQELEKEYYFDAATRAALLNRPYMSLWVIGTQIRIYMEEYGDSKLDALKRELKRQGINQTDGCSVK